MGAAYFKAYRFRDSEHSLAQVLGFPEGRWHKAANLLYKRVQKITADESLAARYLDQKNSPYPDVSPTAPYYNAAMNAVTRGLMETGGLSGAFRPDDNTDGAELLLSIMRLRNVMNIH